MLHVLAQSPSFSTFQTIMRVADTRMPCSVISVLNNNSMAARMCEVGAALMLCYLWPLIWCMVIDIQKSASFAVEIFV